VPWDKPSLACSADGWQVGGPAGLDEDGVVVGVLDEGVTVTVTVLGLVLPDAPGLVLPQPASSGAAQASTATARARRVSGAGAMAWLLSVNESGSASR
jgi:hypothetical protein